MSAAHTIALMIANALLLGTIAAASDAALAWIAVGFPLGAAMMVAMIEIQDRQRHV